MTNDPLLEALERYWGYTTFRPLQREAMEAILDGRDSVVVLPTGGGKSLCFQAPALVRPGLAVVVSPLISLMKDQVDTLVGNGVPAACYNSSLPADEQRVGRCRACARDATGCCTCRPSGWRARAATASSPTLVAHATSASSPSTRRTASASGGTTSGRSTASSARLRQAFPGVSLHAYTATATARVRRDIAAQLGLRDPLELVGSFDRPNLDLPRAVARASLKRQLLDVLARHRGQAGIIYCTSRREVDALAAWLSETGVRAVPYHAGLSDDERSRNQDAFLDEHADVVVATVAFGMGIDRSDVRFVVHAGAPQSLEHYQQESGRAGRDGLEAECVLDLLDGRLPEVAGDARAQRRADRRAPRRCCATWSATPRASAAATGIWSATSASTIRAPSAAPATTASTSSRRWPSRSSLARKILSCVARVGQRFGAAHVTNVLRGSETEQVTARGHDALSTFGLLRDADRARSARLHRAARRASACCARPTTSIRCWR